MSATMDTLELLELVPEGYRDGAMRNNRSKQSQTTARKRHVERWSSTLDPQALQCLLAIVEQQVMPRLIAGYAPAHRPSPGLSES